MKVDSMLYKDGMMVMLQHQNNGPGRLRSTSRNSVSAFWRYLKLSN